jgi:hypothetical protein
VLDGTVIILEAERQRVPLPVLPVASSLSRSTITTIAVPPIYRGAAARFGSACASVAFAVTNIAGTLSSGHRSLAHAAEM